MAQHQRILLLFFGALACVFFFCVYSFLSFTSVSGGAVRLNSPDETANYFFSRNFAEHSTIGYEEPLLAISKGIVHPRSMTTAGNRVVPVGFLGLVVLYGMIGKIIGTHALLFVTPFLAVLSAYFFYRILQQIFDTRTASLSALFLLIHPAYWYYATRSMLPNVLFVDLVIIGLFFLSRACDRKKMLLFFAAGLFIGWALMVRLSELVWVMFGLCVIFFAARHTLNCRRIFSFVGGFCIPLGLLFVLNANVYGHPLLFGYQTDATYESVASLDQTLALIRTFNPSHIHQIESSIAETITKARVYIFPFGVDSKIFMRHFRQYGMMMFWWFTLLSGLGFVLLLWRGARASIFDNDHRISVYCAASFIITLWLVIFYGSWVFSDNITGAVTIGDSYVRYWLPMYILAIPCAAALCSFFLERVRGRIVRMLFVLSCITCMLVLSGNAVLTHFSDSIFAVAQNIRQYQKGAQWIGTVTPQQAVIFSQRSDKNFFPERKVAQSFDGFPEAQLAAALIDTAPVYYYGMWNEKDTAYISKKYFSSFRLHLLHSAEFENNERLFLLTHDK